ncbi:MAG: ABC transporter permease [Thermodesulfobacteriota bacterium]
MEGYQGNTSGLSPRWFFGCLGRSIVERTRHLSNVMGLLTRLIYIFFKERKTGRRLVRQNVIQQIYFTGVQSLGIVSLVALVFGFLVIVQSLGQLTRVGSEEFLGTLLVAVVVREIGPLMTTLVVILRSGMSMSVEIGYMQVLKEMRSLRMLGIDPLHLVVLPRVLGVILAIICLFVWFDAVAITGGYLFAWIFTGTPFSVLLPSFYRAITGFDVIIGFVKALFFGLIISLVCTYQGGLAKKAITEVPQVTARAAVQCLVYCFVLNVLISTFFYL